MGADETSAFWETCPSVCFRDIRSGATPVQSTTVRLACDADELRILLRAEDTHIAATLTERKAALYTEEVLEIFLDPVGDGECYFEIEVNPLNAVLDLVLRRNRSGYRKDFAWVCEGLRTAVRCDSAGWSAELSIPFRSLAADPPRIGESWRANFTRIDRPPAAPRELTAWSPTYLDTFHAVERFGWIDFA